MSTTPVDVEAELAGVLAPGEPDDAVLGLVVAGPQAAATSAMTASTEPARKDLVLMVLLRMTGRGCCGGISLALISGLLSD
jgi:hypothetical protein